MLFNLVLKHLLPSCLSGYLTPVYLLSWLWLPLTDIHGLLGDVCVFSTVFCLVVFCWGGACWLGFPECWKDLRLSWADLLIFFSFFLSQLWLKQFGNEHSCLVPYLVARGNVMFSQNIADWRSVTITEENGANMKVAGMWGQDVKKNQSSTLNQVKKSSLVIWMKTQKQRYFSLI